LDRHARVTRRLAESVAFFGLHWGTAKNIDKRALKRDLDPVDLSGITVLAMLPSPSGSFFACQHGNS